MPVPEALIFDLFGTLVFFDDSRVPTEEIGGRRVPMTVTGLADLLVDARTGLEVDLFLRELRRVGAAIAEEKRSLGIEIPTRVRFERTLAALGVADANATTLAAEMASRHMASLARAVVCPQGRPALLGALGRRHRLALLSNFDDGATARRVVEAAGLAPFFEAIVISEEVGLRKPSRAIFEGTCDRLGVAPASCLYVGDTVVEDIEGASGAGLEALWIRGELAGDAPAPAAACGVLADVDELPDWLERRALSAPGGASR